MSTTEKQLMINVKDAREAYNDGIIDDVKWIRMNFNLADAMTKATILSEIFEDTNQLHYAVEKSVNCTICSPTNEKEKGIM